MNKRFLTVSILIISIVFSSGCNNNDMESLKKEGEGKPVKVMKVEEIESHITLRYIGTVTARDIKKLSFKTTGYIDTIFVKKGQLVKKGDALAKLDVKDLEFNLKASKAQMDIAKTQYDKAINGAEQEDVKKAELNEKKARDAYAFAVDNYEKIKKLFDEDAVSKYDFDNIKLELDLRKSELEQAEEIKKQLIKGSRIEDKNALLHQLKKAETDYLYKESTIEDAVIKADIDGYVVDILYEEGEMCPAGYPAVVIRSNEEIVRTGIAFNEVEKINEETKVMIYHSKDEAEGKIVTIDDMPDRETRTYTTEIKIPEGRFAIGSIVDVEYILGTNKGIWIPVHSIMPMGNDYVFVVKGNNAEKRKIELLEVSGTKVMVNGLKTDELVIIEGMKKINDGEKIIVNKESD